MIKLLNISILKGIDQIWLMPFVVSPNYYLFRRFLKIRDSPRGSEYPKNANFGFILPRFWHKKTRELSLVYS